MATKPDPKKAGTKSDLGVPIARPKVIIATPKPTGIKK